MVMAELASTVFFALEDATTPGKLVVFVDQRKQHFGKFQPSHADTYLSKMTTLPTFLKDRGARLVRVVMNYVAKSNLARLDVPSN